jgi:hypothetical protein
MRTATDAHRQAYLAHLRETLMIPVKSVNSAVIAKSCRDAMQEGHAAAKAAGCAR